MNDPDDEADLRDLFARERDADGRRTPSFAHMRRIARNSAGPRAEADVLAPWLLPAGAALALIVTASFWLTRTPPSRENPAAVGALAERLGEANQELQARLAARDGLAWQSSTDFLLHSDHRQP